MFTLTDPRAQALSQAGGAFGGALSQALGNYIENRKFGSALQGVDQNTPVHEILNRFAAHNVAPELISQYLNPQIQQRISQERALSSLEQVFNRRDKQGNSQQPSPQEVALGLARAGILSPSVGQNLGEVTQAYSNLYRSQNYPGGGGTGNAPVNLQVNTTAPNYATEGQPNSTPQPPTRPVTTNRENRPVKPLNNQGSTPTTGAGIRNAQASGVGGTVAPGVDQAPVAQPSAPDIRNTNPLNINPGRTLTGQEAANTVAQLAPTLGVEGARQFVQDFNAGNANIRQQMIENAQLAQSAKEEQKSQDDYWGKQADSYLGASGRQIDPLFRNAIVSRMQQLSGAPQERFQEALKEQDRLQNKAQKVLEGTKRPIAAAFNPKPLEEWKELKGNNLRALLQDPAIPPQFRDQYVDKFRTLAQAADISSLEFEYMINKPTLAEGKILNSIPKQEVKKTTSAFGIAEEPVKDVEKLSKIADQVIRLSQENPRLSPLIVRDMLMTKGYSDQTASEIYGIAREKGAQFSPYQEEQIGDLAMPARGSLKSILRGEQTGIGLWDQFIKGKK